MLRLEQVLEQELQDLRVTVDTMKQAAELQKEAAEDKLAAVKREASAGLQRSTSPGGAEEEEKIARKPLDAPPSENFHTPLGRTPSAMGLKKSLSDPVLSKKTAELEKQVRVASPLSRSASLFSFGPFMRLCLCHRSCVREVALLSRLASLSACFQSRCCTRDLTSRRVCARGVGR